MNGLTSPVLDPSRNYGGGDVECRLGGRSGQPKLWFYTGLGRECPVVVECKGTDVLGGGLTGGARVRTRSLQVRSVYCDLRKSKKSGHSERFTT